jgi:hypothetical protein
VRSTATRLAALAALLLLAPTTPKAQEPEGGAVAEETAADEEPLLSDEELDDLVAPVALYPDALLSQVLVASTYPLEIVKAQRWVDANRALPAADRAEAVAGEDWDPSVAALAAGFPDVLLRMADDLDWTETLGEALLAQSEDVLDAVQRQRARAAAAGNLESNPAQTVTVEDDAISIAPTDPQVIYVPTYDPAVAYAPPPAGYAPPPPSYTLADPYAPPPGTAVVTSPGATTVVEEGYSGGELITTGILAFGAGMLVSEVFDDDDDWDDWDGPRIDWDDDDIYHRPGRGDVDIDGDVNINTGTIDVDRPGKWKPDQKRRDEAVASLDRKKKDRPRRDGAQAQRPGAQAGAQRPARDRDRAAAAASVQNRVGPAAKDRPKRAKDDGQAAKQLRERGDRPGGAQAQKPQRDRAAKTGLDRPRDGLAETKAAKKRGQKTVNKAGPAAKPKGAAAKPKPAAKSRPAAKPKPQRSKAVKTGNRSSLKPDRGGAKRASAQKNRGAKSAKRGGHKPKRK